MQFEFVYQRKTNVLRCKHCIDSKHSKDMKSFNIINILKDKLKTKPRTSVIK